MDDRKTAATTASLKEAMRRARIEEAERTGVVIALRDAEFARLSMLHDRLKPILDQIPEGIDLFDAGLVPGETPRLWIDMIAFVEMGRDKRTYRFLQDTRHGRRVMAESEDAGLVADRVTAYVARRLIERERMLALPPVPAETAVPHPVLPRADMPATLAGAAPAWPAASAQPAEGAGPVADDTPANGSSAAGGTAEAGPAGAVRDAAARRVRFSGLGGFVLFLLGVAAGAGGLLGFAQLAARF